MEVERVVVVVGKGLRVHGFTNLYATSEVLFLQALFFRVRHRNSTNRPTTTRTQSETSWAQQWHAN